MSDELSQSKKIISDIILKTIEHSSIVEIEYEGIVCERLCYRVQIKINIDEKSVTSKDIKKLSDQSTEAHRIANRDPRLNGTMSWIDFSEGEAE